MTYLSQLQCFSYDALNRLTAAKTGTDDACTTGTTTGLGYYSETYSYADNGNLAYKSSTGVYTYGGSGAGPHAVTWVSVKRGIRSLQKREIRCPLFIKANVQCKFLTFNPVV